MVSVETSRGDATYEDIRTFLVAHLSEVIGAPVGDNVGDVPFADLGVDSMTSLGLLAALQARFRKAVAPEAMALFPTLETLARAVADPDWRNLYEAALPTAERVREVDRAVAGGAFSLDPEPVPHPSWSIRSVLLTGATGVLGAHILKDLLEKTSCRVLCLVRAASREGGKRRLRTFLSTYADDSLVGELDRRVEAIPGDLSRPRLGLSETEYERLAGSVDVVIHNAASTDLYASYRDLSPANIEGTAQVAELALRTAHRYLVHVSSYSIFGDSLGEARSIDERDFDVGQRFTYLSGYPRTKFHAEKIIRGSTERGLIWKIARPGDIFGESVSGRYPFELPGVTSLYYELLRALVETGVVPDVPRFLLRPVPVDYVSAGIVHLTLEHHRAFDTLHLVPSQPTTLEGITGILAACGHPIRRVTGTEYRTRMADYGRSAFAVGLMMWAMSIPEQGSDGGQTSGATVEARATRVVLERAGITCPEFDAQLVSRYLAYCTKVGFLEGRAS